MTLVRSKQLDPRKAIRPNKNRRQRRRQITKTFNLRNVIRRFIGFKED